MGSPNLRPRYNKNWFAVLFLCLLSTLHSVFVVIMDIDIVIPKTGDQSDPDIQMLCFRIEVELCRSIGRLRTPLQRCNLWSSSRCGLFPVWGASLV